MARYESITDLADAAAALLPGPPPDGDVTGYLQWRELVWGTALRLGRIGGPIDPAYHDFDAWDARAEGAAVTGAELLELAAQLPRTAESDETVPAASETSKATVTRAPTDHTAPRPR